VGTSGGGLGPPDSPGGAKVEAAPGVPLAGAVVPVGPKPGTPGDVGSLLGNALDGVPGAVVLQVGAAVPWEGSSEKPLGLVSLPLLVVPLPEGKAELAPPLEDPKPLLPLSNCARAEPPPSSHPAARRAIQRRLKVMESASVQERWD
jgi:hypothetical protein